MGDMITDIDLFSRRSSGNGMDTTTALIIGAGLGIAVWEMAKRRKRSGVTNRSNL